MSDPIVSCANCGWQGLPEDTEMLIDADERVAPGELMPCGQCPECEAVVGCHDDQIEDHTLQVVAAVMRKRGWTVQEPTS